MENLQSEKPKIRVIPAISRQELIREKSNGKITKIRVGPYARVSTDHEEQESSYEEQVKHFTKLIKEHTDWEMVDMYADPGLSGKNIKRPNFLRLMKDCEDGEIDMVITKSVSRFARNTLDCVQSVRKLKEKGIKVYFEKENLDTMQESSEFVLTIMASLAEEESRSISNNIRWSFNKRFKDGKVMLSTKHFLGYTKYEKNGRLEIVPKEAVIVKRIYQEFLDGLSLEDIKKRLEEDKILSPSGKEKWYTSTIRSILTNEKYKGDSHLQKTYLPDFLSPHRIKNEGQIESYYVEDDHPAIIDKKTFDMVQEEIKTRNNIRTLNETGHGKFSGKYAFSGMIKCGVCGDTYRRHYQYNKYKKYYTWACKRHENTGMANCSAKPIKEKALEDAFVKSLNEILTKKEELLNRFKKAIDSTITDDYSKAIEELDTKIEFEQNEIVRLLEIKDKILSEDYDRRLMILTNKINKFQIQKEEIVSEYDKIQIAEIRKEEIMHLLNNGKIITEFDQTILKMLVKEIRVKNDSEIEFIYKCGIRNTQKVR